MKNPFIFLPLAVLMFSTVLMGCDSPAKNVADAKDELHEAQVKLAESKKDSIRDADWREFKAASQEKIAANQVRITEMKLRSTSKAALKTPGYEQQITDLENRNETLQHRIDDYEKYNSNWEVFKREFNHDMEELGKSMKDLTVDNSK